MLVASVNLQFPKHMSRQVVLLWQHSLDSQEDQVRWLSFQAFAIGFDLLAVVSVIPSVVAVFEFSAAHLDLFRIDHDHKFAGVDVWGVLRAVLAHQNHSDFTRESAERAVGCVDYIPFLIDFTCLCDCCLLLSNHNNSSMFSRCDELGSPSSP